MEQWPSSVVLVQLVLKVQRMEEGFVCSWCTSVRPYSFGVIQLEWYVLVTSEEAGSSVGVPGSRGRDRLEALVQLGDSQE